MPVCWNSLGVDEIDKVPNIFLPGRGRVHDLFSLVSHNVHVVEIISDQLVGVIVVVGHVQNMIHASTDRVGWTVTVNIHTLLLSNPRPISHDERLTNPVLLA